MRIIAGVAPLRRSPADDAPMETQMLFGEIFSVHEEKDGWARGQAALDLYPGYVRRDALGPVGPAATHTVAVPRSFVYRDADIKSPPVLWLSMNATVAVAVQNGAFARIENLGWIFAAHLAPCGNFADDFVTIAEGFLGVPYLWGGKDSLGMDCSGLLQTCMQRAGLICPRDTYQQIDLGSALAADHAPLQRGDLIFWKGHVGMMRNAATLLHANAFHMQVASEALSQATDRIAASGSPVAAVRRLPRLSG